MVESPLSAKNISYLKSYLRMREECDPRRMTRAQDRYIADRMVGLKEVLDEDQPVMCDPFRDISITFPLPYLKVRQLSMISQREGSSFAEIIARSIDNYIAEHK